MKRFTKLFLIPTLLLCSLVFIACNNNTKLPSKVKNLQATAGDNEVILTWEAPEINANNVTYEISINNFVDKVTTDILTYTWTNLTNGQSYTFKVRAVNDKGFGTVESVTETPVATVIPEPTRLAKPANLKLENDSLTWDANPNASSYNVHVVWDNYYMDKYNEGAMSDSYNTTSASTLVQDILEVITDVSHYSVFIEAVGDGQLYLNSELSDVYESIKRGRFEPVTGLDIQGTTVSWDAFPVNVSASYINIEIFVESVKVEEVSSGTEIDLADALKDLAPGVYDITARVTGDELYLDSSEFTIATKYIKTTNLVAPQNVILTGTGNNKILWWDAAPNATGYTVLIDGKTYNTTSASYILSSVELNPGVYSIKVLANGDSEVYLNSVYSSSVEYIKSATLSTPTGLDVERKPGGDIISWTHVTGASSYKVHFYDDHETSEALKHTTYNVIADTQMRIPLAISPARICYIQVEAIGDGVVYYNSQTSSMYQYVISQKLNMGYFTYYNGIAQHGGNNYENYIIWNAASLLDGTLFLDATYSIRINTGSGLPKDDVYTENGLTMQELDDGFIGIFEISKIMHLLEDGEYSVYMQANADNLMYLNSEWKSDFGTGDTKIIIGDLPNQLIKLSTPVVEKNENTLSWEAVEHAVSYRVYLYGYDIILDVPLEVKYYDTTELFMILPNRNDHGTDLYPIGDYQIYVQAIGDGEIYESSGWQENAIEHRMYMFAPMVTGIELNGTVLSWDAAEDIGYGVSYKIYINDTIFITTENLSRDLAEEFAPLPMGTYRISVETIYDNPYYTDSGSEEYIQYVKE